MIVLDTDVLSEPHATTTRSNGRSVGGGAAGDQPVHDGDHPGGNLYGLALLPAGRRRNDLAATVDAIFELDLAGRVLPFDSAAAREFATIAASRRQSGRPMAQADAQIAAIAGSRGAVLATRNVADFEACGVRVIGPWHA